MKNLFPLILLVFIITNANAYGTVLYEMDFNAGNYNGLTVDSGSWSATSNYLEGGGADNASIGKALTINRAGLASDENIMISYSAYIDTSPFGDFAFMTTTTSSATTTGYRLYASSPNCGFGKVNASALFTFSCASSTWLDMNIMFDNAGNYTVYKNGVAQGTATDTTYTNGNYIYMSSFNGAGGQNQRWDTIRIVDCQAGSCNDAPASPPSPNIPPVLVALNYPNAQGLTISGTHDINFDFTDDDFNVLSAYTFDITKINTDGNVETFIQNDGNAFSICDNMDTNLTTKNCLFSFDFDTLGYDANYSIKVSVSDDQNESNVIHGYTFATPTAPLTPPDVNFSYSPLSPDTDDTITFTPAIVANGTLSVVMWSFEGDANVNYFAPITDENTEQTIIFSTSGTKTVCLTAGNEDGNTTLCQDIDVVDAPVAPSGYVSIYSITEIPLLIIDFIGGVLGVFVDNAITVIGLVILGLILYIFRKINIDKLTDWIK